MKTLNLALVAILALAATPTLAANVDVQLLNKGDKGAMVFQPDLVKIAVGDTVTYQPTDKATTSTAPPATSRLVRPHSRAK